MKNIFVVVLRYLVPIDVIELHRAKHLEFLDEYYSSGLFIASGRQTPASGGIILAVASNREEIESIINDDPFKIHKLAEYQVFEFTPSKYSKALGNFMQDISQ